MLTDSVSVCYQPPAAEAAPAAAVKPGELTKSSGMKVRWTQLGLLFFLALSLVMTGCFFWQYQLPKVLRGECVPDKIQINHFMKSLSVYFHSFFPFRLLKHEKCLRFGLESKVIIIKM